MYNVHTSKLNVDPILHVYSYIVCLGILVFNAIKAF